MLDQKNFLLLRDYKENQAKFKKLPLNISKDVNGITQHIHLADDVFAIEVEPWF